MPKYGIKREAAVTICHETCHLMLICWTIYYIYIFFSCLTDICEKSLPEAEVEITFTSGEGTPTDKSKVPVIPNNSNTVTVDFESPDETVSIAVKPFAIVVSDTNITSITVEYQRSTGDNKTRVSVTLTPTAPGMFTFPEEYRVDPLTSMEITFDASDIEEVEFDLQGCIEIGKISYLAG